MKKILAVLFAFILLIGVASAANYSSMTDEELLNELNVIRNELLARDLFLSPDEVLIETKNIKVYLDKSREITLAFGSINIPVILINNMDNEMGFFLDHQIVNGWDVSSGVIGHISGKAKGKRELCFDLSSAGISTIEEIEDIKFVISVMDMVEYENVLETKPFVYVIKNGQFIRK